MSAKSRRLIDYVEQRNAVTVLLALHHLSSPHWKVVEVYSLRELGTVSLSWQSYKRLCKQLVTIGLAEYVERSTNARDYRLTKYGHQIASIIEEALKKISK